MSYEDSGDWTTRQTRVSTGKSGDLDNYYASSGSERNSHDTDLFSLPLSNKPNFLKRLGNATEKALRSVEIPLFLYFVATGLFNGAQQRLITGKLCLREFRNMAVCQAIAAEDPAYAGQRETIVGSFTSFETVAGLCTNLPLIIVAVMHGSWCDRIWHRASMIMPHVGDALLGLLYIVYSKSNPLTMDPQNFAYFSILSGLSGSWAVITMACCSHAMISTSLPERLFRLALLESAVTGGQLVAYFLNALVFKGSLTPLAFIVQICLHLVAITHIAALVKEVHSKEFVERLKMQNAHGRWLKNLWVPKENFPAVVQIFTKAPETRPREAPRYQRIFLVTYLFAGALLGFKALLQVLQNYLTLPPIAMKQNAFALFMAICSLTMTIALALLIRLFKLKCFHFSDAAIGIFGLVTRMLALIVIGMADFFPKLAIVLYCVLSTFSLFPLIAIRSGMSKLTDDTHQGRLFAVTLQVENFSQTAAMFGFNALFQELVIQHNVVNPEMLGILHGYTFFFVAGCTLLPLLGFLWLAKQRIVSWSFHKNAPSTYSYLEEHPVN